MSLSGYMKRRRRNVFTSSAVNENHSPLSRFAEKRRCQYVSIPNGFIGLYAMDNLGALRQLDIQLALAVVNRECFADLVMAAGLEQINEAFFKLGRGLIPIPLTTRKTFSLCCKHRENVRYTVSETITREPLAKTAHATESAKGVVTWKRGIVGACQANLRRSWKSAEVANDSKSRIQNKIVRERLVHYLRL